MNTGFFPEPNYVLAATGGLGFAFVSYWLHMIEAWYFTIMVFSFLSMTSVWFHIWRTEFAYRIDNALAMFLVPLLLYEGYLRGIVAFGIGLLTSMYGALVFYVGHFQQSYAFHPNRTIATFFHASIHIFTVLATSFVFFFFPVHLANEEVPNLLLCPEGDRVRTDCLPRRGV